MGNKKIIACLIFLAFLFFAFAAIHSTNSTSIIYNPNSATPSDQQLETYYDNFGLYENNNLIFEGD